MRPFGRNATTLAPSAPPIAKRMQHVISSEMGNSYNWAEAHNLMFNGDGESGDGTTNVPPGLISSEQLADIASIWKKLDTDGSGTLSLQELDRALKLLGYESGDEDTAELIRLIDADGSGVIEWEEFRTLLVTKVVEESNQVEVDFTFAMLDLNGDGHIDAKEVQALLMHAGERLSEAEAADLVDLLSAGTGTVTSDSFQAGMDRIFMARPSTSLAHRHTSKGTREARKTLHARRGLFPYTAFSRRSTSSATVFAAKAAPLDRAKSSPMAITRAREDAHKPSMERAHSSPATAICKTLGYAPSEGPRRNSLSLPVTTMVVGASPSESEGG